MSEHFKAGYFDIDKTILERNSKELTEAMVQALGKIPLRGVNSYRGINQIEQVLPQGLMNLPHIALTGGEIWHTHGEMMHAFPLTLEAREALATALIPQAEEISFARFYPLGNRRNILYTCSDEIEKKCREQYTRENNLGVITRSIHTFASHLEGNSTATLILRPRKNSQIELPSSFKEKMSVNDIDPEDIIITQTGVNKGSSVLWLCQELNIDPTQVLTAGDSAYTDCDAFQGTHGISVGEKKLPHAQIQVANPEGLAAYIETLFSSR